MPKLDDKTAALLKLITEPHLALLCVLLVAASIYDYRTYKIPNWLTAGGIVFALIYSAVMPSHHKPSFPWAVGGMVVGFLALLPCYVLRIMGAGDVKLMAMVGAFLGVTDTLHAIIYSFIAGGVAALLFAFHNQALSRMFINLKNMTQMLMLSAMGGFKPDMQIQSSRSVGTLAYGVCIGVGTLAYLVKKNVAMA